MSFGNIAERLTLRLLQKFYTHFTETVQRCISSILNKLTCGDRSSSSISLSYSCSPAVADFEFVAMINGVLEKSTDSNTLEDGLLFFLMVILCIEVDLASSEGLSLKLDTKLVFAKLL